MNKKIMMSVLIIGMVALLAGVGVYALFSDTVKSTGNTFSTSTLDLKADGSDTMLPMDIAHLAPGDDGAVYHSQWFTLTKAGSVAAGKLSFKIDNVHDVAGVDGNGDLSANAVVGVYFPDEDTKVGDFTVAQLESGIAVTDDFDGAIGTATDKGILLAAGIPEATGNEVQGDALTFDGHLSLEQTATAH